MLINTACKIAHKILTYVYLESELAIRIPKKKGKKRFLIHRRHKLNNLILISEKGCVGVWQASVDEKKATEMPVRR